MGGAFLVLGGGRSAFIGVALVLLLSFLRRGLKPVLKIAVPMIVVYLIMNSVSFGGERSVLESQQQRLFMYESLIERQTHRVEGYQALLEAWSENPIFGKGISPTGETGQASIEETGGHGSYVSLLGLFGIFGLVFVVLAMAYPLYGAVRHVLRYRSGELPMKDLVPTRFASLMMLFLAVILSVAGNGYGNPSLFFITGILVGFLEREKQAAGAPAPQPAG
jgi:O-antigen ligase